jgi:hypothetical protein
VVPAVTARQRTAIDEVVYLGELGHQAPSGMVCGRVAGSVDFKARNLSTSRHSNWVSSCQSLPASRSSNWTKNAPRLRPCKNRAMDEDERQARDELATLEGLLRAMDRRDEVFQVVEDSETVDEAIRRVGQLLGIGAVSSRAVIDLQVRRFTAKCPVKDPLPDRVCPWTVQALLLRGVRRKHRWGPNTTFRPRSWIASSPESP